MTGPLLAAAVVVASCGSQQRAMEHGGVVPWVDTPAPTYTPPPWVAPPAGPASAAPCRARQLRVTSSQFAAAAGSGVQRFAFTNVSSATCMLGGSPTVTGELASGKRRVLHIARPAGGTFAGKVVPADIPPGKRGILDLAFSDACPTGRRVLASNVAFAPPGGGSVETRYRIWRACHGLAMSQLGRHAPEPLPPHRKPGTPRHATRGSVPEEHDPDSFRFEVALRRDAQQPACHPRPLTPLSLIHRRARRCAREGAERQH